MNLENSGQNIWKSVYILNLWSLTLKHRNMSHFNGFARQRHEAAWSDCGGGGGDLGGMKVLCAAFYPPHQMGSGKVMWPPPARPQNTNFLFYVFRGSVCAPSLRRFLFFPPFILVVFVERHRMWTVTVQLWRVGVR